MGKIFLVLLEYVMLPLVAITASFHLKKAAKKNLTSLEDFLEDLNIDIKVICAFGLILFALNNVIHNETNESYINNYSWGGIAGALLGYIVIQNFKFKTSHVTAKGFRYFGIRNSVYKDSSWFAVVLIFYIISGLALKSFLKEIDYNNVWPSIRNSVYYLGLYLILLPICLWAFFYLLNLQVRSFMFANQAYLNTMSNAFSINIPHSEDANIKRFNLILATVKADNPILISAYERLSELYERKRNLIEAEFYLDKVIELLKNNKINQEPDYLIDAYLTKVDFYKRNNMQKASTDLIKFLQNNFPENSRLKNV